jgi:hypothetical protein
MVGGAMAYFFLVILLGDPRFLLRGTLLALLAIGLIPFSPKED